MKSIEALIAAKQVMERRRDQLVIEGLKVIKEKLKK